MLPFQLCLFARDVVLVMLISLVLVSAIVDFSWLVSGVHVFSMFCFFSGIFFLCSRVFVVFVFS